MVGTDKKLAQKIGVDYTTIGTWKRRGLIPENRLYNIIHLDKSIDYNWLTKDEKNKSFDNPSQTNYNKNSNIAILNSGTNNGHQIHNGNGSEVSENRSPFLKNEKPNSITFATNSETSLKQEIIELLDYAGDNMLLQFREKLLKIKEITES
jgi:hypothetical protein